MPAMRRLLTLLLGLYVLLDVTNPHIPGAVTFDGGVMETAQAERHRPVARPPDEPLLDALAFLAWSPDPVVRTTTRVTPAPHIWIAQRSHPSGDRPTSVEDD
jgi:hypothetical protein